MAKPALIPIHVLRQLLDYDPETGNLTWRERPREMFNNKQSWLAFGTRYAGKPALIAVCKGYKRGKVMKWDVYAHQIAFALHYDKWPSGVIDHINGKTDDNRIINLRDVTQQENMTNQKLRNTNSSGHNGVSWLPRRGKWLAQMSTKGRHFYLGEFADKADAIEARRLADELHGFHRNHGGVR